MENNIMITSGFNFEHYAITQYLGFCSGECVLGTGFLRSLGASIADFLGSTSSLYEGKLESAKKLHLKNFIPMQSSALMLTIQLSALISWELLQMEHL